MTDSNTVEPSGTNSGVQAESSTPVASDSKQNGSLSDDGDTRAEVEGGSASVNEPRKELDESQSDKEQGGGSEVHSAPSAAAAAAGGAKEAAHGVVVDDNGTDGLKSSCPPNWVKREGGADALLESNDNADGSSTSETFPTAATSIIEPSTGRHTESTARPEQDKPPRPRLEGKGPPPRQQQWTPAPSQTRKVSQALLHAIDSSQDDSTSPNPLDITQDVLSLAPDDEWTVYVQSQLARIFPDMYAQHAQYVEEGVQHSEQGEEGEGEPGVSSFRDDIASLRSELTFLRGLIAEMTSEARAEAVGDVPYTPPAPEFDAGDGGEGETDVGAEGAEGGEVDLEAAGVGQDGPGELEGFKPEIMSLVLDLVRRLDHARNGVRGDAEVFEEGNLRALSDEISLQE